MRIVRVSDTEAAALGCGVAVASPAETAPGVVLACRGADGDAPVCIGEVRGGHLVVVRGFRRE
jgi:hypothetical protein